MPTDTIVGVSAGGGGGTPYTPPDWIAVAHDAGNFTGGGFTWTVSSGDQVTNRYQLTGKTLIWTLELELTSVSGGGGVELQATLPDGLACKAISSEAGLATDDGGAVEVIRIQAAAGANHIGLLRISGNGDWSESTDNTDLMITVTMEVE